MRAMTLAVVLAATTMAIPAAYAQQAPATPADVAKPGGKVPGAPKLALVKVADGFHDPVGGDRCSGRLFGVAWDGGANKWQMQKFVQTQLQFTAGHVDADSFVLATNCYCFYTDDKGPNANPVGALWRIVPADKVTVGLEVAKPKETEPL